MSTTYTIGNSDIQKVDDVLVEEKKRLDQKKELIDKAEFSQNRVQELNESYRKRYVYYNYIVTVVVFALLIYFTLVMLQYFIPIIPSVIVDLAAIVLFAFIIIFVVYNLGIVYSRDKLNFDKIDMNHASIISKEELEKKRRSDVSAGNLSDVAGIDIGKSCIGAACCSAGTMWDAGNLVCKPNVVSSFATITESFSILNGEDLVINGVVKPFEPSEYDNYAKI
jgi:hypothetical protein